MDSPLNISDKENYIEEKVVDMGSRHYGNILFFYLNGLMGSVLVLTTSNNLQGKFSQALSFLVSVLW